MTLWDKLQDVGEMFGFHPSDAQILELADGMESPGRLARVAAHLARCRRCAQRASVMEEALNKLKPLVPSGAPPHWLREGEDFLRQSMAAVETREAAVPEEVLEGLLGLGCRGQTWVASLEMAARLLGSRALARAAAGASGGEVQP